MLDTSILKEKNFRNFWIGQSISKFGDALYYLGFMFMVQKVTQRSDMVGFVGAMELLPFLLLSPYAGSIVDRCDRRKIMLYSNGAAAFFLLLFLGLLLFYPTPPLWSMFTVAFLLSVATVFFGPAKNASIPRLVSTEQLVKANAFSMTTDNLIWLISMVVSASVLALLYSLSQNLFFICFVLINAGSFLLSNYFLAKIPSIVPERENAVGKTSDEIKDGFRYIFKNQLLKLTLLAQIGISLSIAPFFVVYLETNEKWFNGNPGTLALIEASFVLGLVVMSAYVTRLNFKRPGLTFGIGLAVAGFTIGMMAFSQWLPAFIFWNFVAGLAIAVVDVPMLTYLQLAVPDELRGRVLSARSFVSMGVQPAGMIAAGALMERFGIEVMYLLMGAGFTISALIPLLNRRFREVRMPTGQTPPSTA